MKLQTPSTSLEMLEKRLVELIPKEGGYYSSLYDAARYSLLSGGKRLRPQLIFAVAEALDCDPAIVLDPACAIEMIHTYSMIHDDLPCMDDDDLRRGIPTLHKVFGEALALLAGDFLLTHAYKVLAEAPHLDLQQKIAMIQTLASLSGGDGMIGGQVIDITTTGKPVSREILETTHLLKTGALIASSLLFGGLAAGADSDTLKSLRNIGFQLGLAYQVVDDVLDQTSEEKRRGKKEGPDQAHGNTTYATLLGNEKALAYAEDLLEEALKDIQTFSTQNQKLSELAVSLVRRSK
jgi:geranylgeranyl diphosphate synthase, type II